MNQSRQLDNESKYGYGGYNPNMTNNYSNYGKTYSGYIPGNVGQYNPNFTGHYGSNFEKAYSVVNTEPVMINKDGPIILVDPILETHVKSYLTWSLFNVFFCCIFGGVVTTIMSCKVMDLNDNKEYKRALHLSGKVLIANMAVSALGALIFLIVFPYVYVAIYPLLPKINW